MAIQSQIRQLQTPDHSVDVYPLTLEKAVFDAGGVQLPAKILTILSDLATVESTATASKAYAVGEHFIYNNQLYKTTAAISAGDTITPGTNAEPVNVMDEMASGGAVTGVKGNAESTYRKGDVNLTLADLGYESVNNLSATATGKLLDARQGKVLNDSLSDAFADLATVEATATASKAYKSGDDADYLILNGQLYKVTADIAAGGTIVPGTNVTPTTITDEMGAGGHTILTSSGTALRQEVALQFKGMNVTDDTANGKTVVQGQIVKVTQAEYDALSAAEKSDANTTYEITDSETASDMAANITIAASGWSSATVTVDGVAYHTHETVLSSVFDSHPDIYLGALATFPTSAERQAYMAVDYVTVDADSNKLKCYARSVPGADFVIIVKGVSV